MAEQDSSKEEGFLTNPDPFNHGTTSIPYQEVPHTVFDELRNVLQDVWGVEPLSIGQAYYQTDVGSNNFKVDTKSGVLLLKLNHRAQPQELTITNQILAYCEANDVSVPHLIPTPSGESFIIIGGRIFSLYDFIEGEHFDGSRQELTQVAGKFADFNRVLADLPLQDDFKKLSGKTTIHHDWKALDDLSAETRRLSTVSKYDAQLLEQIDEILEISRTLRSFDFASLPMQVAHRDLHPHNLLFQTDSHDFLSFLDFDSLEYTQRLRCVGFAMHRLARTYGEGTERKQDSGADTRDRVRLFLETYKVAGALTAQELEYLPIILQDEALDRISLLMKARYRDNNSLNSHDIWKQLTTLREVPLLF